jgi:RNA polymerase primary sigma factor
MTDRHHAGLLTAADEVRLARRIEQGDAAAKDEMTVRNLRLVHALAARYAGRGVAYEDLVQEGTIGLIRAVEKFDHRRGVKFATYAIWWIRRSLLDAVGDARAIRIPALAARQIAAIQSARAELDREGRAVPPDEAVARRSGLSPPTVALLRAAPRVSVSLDQAVGDGATALVELIADDAAPDAARLAERREARRQLWSALRLLPDRHRQVLVRRYGLLADRAQTHHEIGASLGVGEERSRQLEREGLHRLRELGDRIPHAA